MGYTNSGLVNYTKLSPHCTKPRNHTIDNISIHTMAGNLSVETCGELFQQVEASSNYGIDSHGCIALYVEEANRSWCTSNRANDMRSITIEVASINSTDYRPSDAAYQSLIKLLVDVCRRNNIPKLLWKADKSLIGKVDQQNMTVHRWFKNKGCPGDWLYNHMGQIADEVNKLLNEPVVDKPIVDPPEPIKSEERDMYEFLKGKGENTFFIFGLMGNLWAESGIRANNLQNSYEKKLGMSDEKYSESVDNGSYTNFIRDKAGYGYAQWTFWSRKEALYNFMKSKGVSIAEPSAQRDFLWQELTTTYKGMLTRLRAAKSIREASDIVLTEFEKPADQSESVKIKRASYGQTLFEKYGEEDTPKLPYLVRVIDDALNIRNKPGTKGTEIVGCITSHGVFTIVEEVMVGNTVWGKLKSGAGWICITKYTEKI